MKLGPLFSPRSSPCNNPRRDILRAEDALCAELDEIERRRRSAHIKETSAGNPIGETFAERAARLKLTALCLSGGGIRSTSFCLGVLQSLAAARVLNEFDYLSTVSGGGFIGGWLQMLLREVRDVAQVQDRIGRSGAHAVQRLRAYTNYLSPQAGPFSADTWAGLVLYLRNLLLNWLVFMPLILLVTLLPIGYRTLLGAVRENVWIGSAALALAGLSLAIAAWRACTLLPSHRTGTCSGFATTPGITRHIMAPALVWAWLVPAWIDCALTHRHLPRTGFAVDWARSLWVVPLVYAAALLLGYWTAWLRSKASRDAAPELYATNHGRWLAATACAALLVGLGIYLVDQQIVVREWVAHHLIEDPYWLLVDRETALAVLFPLGLIATHVLQTTFYVAFRKEGLLADLDREWLARLSGSLLRVGIVWAAFAICCLVLPRLLGTIEPSGTLVQELMGRAAAVAAALGGGVAWFGRKLSAGIEAVAGRANHWQGPVLAGLTLLFGVLVFAAAGSLLQVWLGQVQDGVAELLAEKR